jgi:hypothetical protein
MEQGISCECFNNENHFNREIEMKLEIEFPDKMMGELETFADHYDVSIKRFAEMVVVEWVSGFSAEIKIFDEPVTPKSRILQLGGRAGDGLVEFSHFAHLAWMDYFEGTNKRHQYFKKQSGIASKVVDETYTLKSIFEDES